MDFYVDSAFLCGFMLNYFCLDIASSVLEVYISRKRILFFSAVYSAVGILIFVYCNNMLFSALVYITLSYFALGRCSLAELLRRCGVLLCISLVLSAIYFALLPRNKTLEVFFENKSYFFADDIYFYGISGMAYVLTKLLILAVHVKKRIFRVFLKLGDEVKEATAIIDTGNSLRENNSGKPIIIADSSLFNNIKSKPIIVPCKTISNAYSEVKAYPLDEVYFPCEKRRVKNIYIAFSEKPLCESKSYNVLLHNSFERKNRKEF